MLPDLAITEAEGAVTVSPVSTVHRPGCQTVVEITDGHAELLRDAIVAQDPHRPPTATSVEAFAQVDFGACQPVALNDCFVDILQQSVDL